MMILVLDKGLSDNPIVSRKPSTASVMHFKYFLLLIGSTLVLSQQTGNNECTTPDGKSGVCVVFQNCNQLYSQILKTNTNRRQILKQIRSFLCGFNGLDSMVCCPTTNEKLTSEPIAPETTSCPLTTISVVDPVDRINIQNQPPDVSVHPNIALLPENCGESDDNRISNGNMTSLYQFPWMALISYQTRLGRKFYCGGTIINDRYILTAAHCLTNLRIGMSLAGVRVGEHDISTDDDCEGPLDDQYCAEPYQDIGIEESIPHPEYTIETMQNDIGLIRLATPIISNDNVLPICLPYTRELSNFAMDGKRFTVTGWGTTENGTTSNILLMASLPVITNEECDGIYNRSIAGGIGFRQVCAGNKIGSCTGDSGGPMQTVFEDGDKRTYQFGIISFGTMFCGMSTSPSVFTRVPYFMDWILDNIKQ